MKIKNLFITGEITNETANRFKKAILDATNSINPIEINVYIDSIGGSVAAGMEIYDCIQNCGVPVNMFCTGKAYSMAAVLFLAATGTRTMLETSEVMIHAPRVSNLRSGTVEELTGALQALTARRDQLVDIISLHTGNDRNDVSKDISFDHYFNADEAVAYGMADTVVRKCA